LAYSTVSFLSQSTTWQQRSKPQRNESLYQEMTTYSTPHSLGSMEAAYLSGSQEKESKPSAIGHKRTFSNVSDSGQDVEDDNDSDKRHSSTDEKKMKRVMANRRSARESRERRKSLLSNLEASVDILSKENANLVRENSELRKQLARLMPQANLECLTSNTCNLKGFRPCMLTKCAPMLSKLLNSCNSKRSNNSWKLCDDDRVFKHTLCE
jgi:bZIP transcription factor